MNPWAVLAPYLIAVAIGVVSWFQVSAANLRAGQAELKADTAQARMKLLTTQLATKGESLERQAKADQQRADLASELLQQAASRLQRRPIAQRTKLESRYVFVDCPGRVREQAGSDRTDHDSVPGADDAPDQPAVVATTTAQADIDSTWAQAAACIAALNKAVELNAVPTIGEKKDE